METAIPLKIALLALKATTTESLELLAKHALPVMRVSSTLMWYL
jgi:hypothetical protein